MMSLHPEILALLKSRIQQAKIVKEKKPEYRDV
jgi:hypothetical protein